MDSVVNKYVRKWLEIPISGTLSNVYLTNNKFGQNIYPPSIKFVQCQTVARNVLKTPSNHSINNLWKTTSESKNIQYDVYTSTKEVLKSFTSGQEDKLQNHLILQGSFFSNVIKFSLSKLMAYYLNPNQTSQRTSITSPSVTSITHFQLAKTLLNGEYCPTVIAPSA